MQSAHLRLTRYQEKETSEGDDLALALLPQFFSTCVSCMLSEKAAVKQTAATAMQVRESHEVYLITLAIGLS